jgi:hypothetical protein
VFADVAPNGGDEGPHAAERASAQALAGDLSEEALDEIQPGGSGRGEVEMKARVFREPRLDQGMLVGAVVVQNEMDVLPARGLPINRVQECQEFAVGVARLTPLDDVALEDIQRGKERGGAMPLIVRVWRAGTPGRRGKMGCVRSSA